MIVAAAIRLDGKVYALPAPARHHNVIHHMVHICGIKPPIVGDQGFVDSNLGFVDRKTAWKIAEENKQIKTENIRGGTLYSEDVW